MPEVRRQSLSAGLLRRAGEPSGASCLVALQPSGTRRPLFAVHPAGGNILGWERLAAEPVTVPGDHLSLLSRDNVEALAERLGPCLWHPPSSTRTS